MLLLHFWLSKAFSFIAFPAETFVSKWIGNYHFYTNETSEKTRKLIISTITNTLSDKSTPVGKEIAKLPQSIASHITNTVETCPFNIGTTDSPVIHWAIYLNSPSQMTPRNTAAGWRLPLTPPGIMMTLA